MLISIEEISAWTGLSTRAIRNYIRDGFLQGDISSGKWMFTLAQYEAFLEHPNIAPVMDSKHKSFINSILDSVPEDNSRICIFLDLLNHAWEAFRFFVRYLEEKGMLFEDKEVQLADKEEQLEKVVLSMWPLKGVDGTRITVIGPQDTILEMLTKYNEEKKKWN